MSRTPHWLEARLAEFAASIDGDRRAHAYLLSGPAGVGKRVLAAAMAHAAFGGRVPLTLAPEWPSHADFHRIAPLDGKTMLAVEQVRELIVELTMTAYAGGTKVAIVEAADTMSHAAANALLKTLEEPPGDCCIVLIADRLLNLPATILSRCVHWKLAAPASNEATRDWVDASDRSRAARALRMAAGGPLQARAWLDDGTAAEWDELEAGLNDLVAGGADAAALASTWSRRELPQLLRFLLAVVEDAIHAALASGRAATLCRPAIESVAGSVDVRDLFCYQDRVRQLLAQPKGSYSEPAVLETLLLAWQRRFRGQGSELPLLPVRAAGPR
ncbi:MAG: hypothetical protein AAFM91_11550 [Pseudomonadota bacterium]